MQVVVQPGGRKVNLTQRDFLASGGQGAVYVVGGRAYKVYHDPANMIPQGKMTALSKITDSNVIKPEHTLLDLHGNPVGYAMRFIENAWTACQLFPRVFRDRHHLKPERTLKLVGKLRDMVANVHRAGVLIVDLNEMNLLVSQDFSEIYGIDADSYQTPGYPATVIMPSVRDPKVQGLAFTELSDWYAFGVVAFQLFVGIHPYKGKHPQLRTFTERAEAGISVFHKDVSVPKAVLSFDVIPSHWRTWFEQVFEKGHRVAPPTSAGAPQVVVPVVRTVGGTHNLDIQLLHHFSAGILGMWNRWQSSVISTTEGVELNYRPSPDPFNQIVSTLFSPLYNVPVVASRRGRLLNLFNLNTRRPVSFSLEPEQVVPCENRLYLKIGGGIHELTLRDAGSRVFAETRLAANCMEHATQLYEGVAVQNMLGKTHLTLFPEAGSSHTTPVPELDDYTVVDARCLKNVLMVIGVSQKGVYDRLVFRFSTDRKLYDVRIVPDITPTGLNFTVLDTGVVACITEEEKLELFTVRRGNSGIKVVSDNMLGGDMTLGTQNGKVIFWRGADLYQMSTK